MGNNKRIAIITTSRSDWVSLGPIARQIERTPGLELILIAGAYHFVKELGYSFRDIKKEGFKRVKKVVLNQKNYQDMFPYANELQRKTINLLSKTRPDIVIIVGDRLEQLECAIAAKAIDCKIVHLCGGDLSGNLDNMFRYAISALADYHLVKTRQSKNRLIARGTDRSKIAITGLPAFDFISEIEPQLSEQALEVRFKVAAYGYFLVLFNPDDYDNDRSYLRMKSILSELKPYTQKKIIVMPNGDSGSAGIIKAIKDVCKRDNGYAGYKSIAPEEFLLLEKYAALMIGNSSSALWEAPIFGTPAINLGSRQDKREALLGVISKKSYSCFSPIIDKQIMLPSAARLAVAKKNRRSINMGRASFLTVKYLKEYIDRTRGGKHARV